MRNATKLLSVSLIALAALSFMGCNRLKARDQLNKGVRAYKAGQFNEAIEHFKDAVQLDPSLVNAKLYLATAYQNQFIPGAPSEDNLRTGQQAVNVYQSIIDSHPPKTAEINATAGLASLYFGMGQFDKSKQYYQKLTEMDPNNPVNYYSIGSIDWTQSFKQRMSARLGVGIGDQLQPFVGPKASREAIQACEQTRQKDLPQIEEGLKDLQKALELRSQYSDAMQYVNLLYRERADLQCRDTASREADLKQADQWVAKALDARKQEDLKAQQKGGAGGVTSSQ